MPVVSTAELCVECPFEYGVSSYRLTSQIEKGTRTRTLKAALWCKSEATYTPPP